MLLGGRPSLLGFIRLEAMASRLKAREQNPHLFSVFAIYYFGPPLCMGPGILLCIALCSAGIHGCIEGTKACNWVDFNPLAAPRPSE